MNESDSFIAELIAKYGDDPKTILLVMAKLFEDKPPTSQVETLIGISNSLNNLSHYKLTIALLESLGKIHRKVLTDKLESARLTNLAVAYYNLGQVKQSLKLNEKALKIDEKIHDKHGEAMSYTNIGVCYCALSKVEKSKQFHRKAIELFRSINDNAGVALATENLAAVTSKSG